MSSHDCEGMEPGSHTGEVRWNYYLLHVLLFSTIFWAQLTYQYLRWILNDSFAYLRHVKYAYGSLIRNSRGGGWHIYMGICWSMLRLNFSAIASRYTWSNGVSVSCHRGFTDIFDESGGTVNEMLSEYFSTNTDDQGGECNSNGWLLRSQGI